MSFPSSYVAWIRQRVGPQKIFLAYSAVIAIDENGRFLLAQWPGADFWVLPGGYAHLGETISHAVIREVAEETGLTITPQRIIGVYSSTRYHYIYPNGDKVKGTVVLFCATVTGGILRPEAPEAAEIGRLAWVPLDEVRDRVDPTWWPMYQQALAHRDNGYFVD